jgi:hypothetical protein
MGEKEEFMPVRVLLMDEEEKFIKIFRPTTGSS